MEKYVWSDNSLPVIDVHSIKKHEVIREYLLQYIRILGNTIIHVDHLDITFIDGFSGGGLYKAHDGSLHEGSPLVFLRASEEAAFEIQQEKQFHLNAHYIFIDEKRAYIDFLKKVLIDRGYGQRLDKDIFLQCGLFQDRIDNVISYIQKRRGTAGRCIFLLDQYGWSDVPIFLLQKIFRNLRGAEVILTFAVDAMIDYMNTDTMYIKSMENTGFDIDITSNILSEKSQKGYRAIAQYKLYRELIKNIGMKHLFHTNFFIKSSESSRSYWLLHFSTHPKARDEMMKLHWKFHNHFVHEGKSGFHMLMYDPRNDSSIVGQGSFSFDSISQQLNNKSLMYDIPESILQDEWIRVEDLFKRECNQTSATFDHILDAIKSLYEYGEIEVRTKADTEKRKKVKINKTDLIKIPSQLRFFTFSSSARHRLPKAP